MALLDVKWYILLLQVSLSLAEQHVFQVHQPVLPGNNGQRCNEDILLMQHTFGSSYGKPFVGAYQPPSCDFDTIIVNLTVTSKGRQFDRLGLMYLGDIEVFRTSTAEPTADGIVWSYIKDMSAFNALWERPQKLIFDLGNSVTDVYTGLFNVTLTATFSKHGNGSGRKAADVIMPISAQKSGSDSPSAFTVPGDKAKVYHRLPSSAVRAIVAVSACGQASEEFWWSNVFSSDALAFNDSKVQLDGYSPFREVQLYIDGFLAGVVWPFPVVFTGGVSPGFWRPVVGIDAFDLRQPEIDISPFLSLLTDQQGHSFELKVTGLDLLKNGTAVPSSSVGSNWVVTGSIFVYLNDTKSLSSAVAHKLPQVDAPAPDVSVSRSLEKDSNGTNEALSYFIQVDRKLTITSPSLDYSWIQDLSFSNYALVGQKGLVQTNNQTTSGSNSVSQKDGHVIAESAGFEYLIYFHTTDSTAGDTDAQMKRGLSISSSGSDGVSTYTFHAGPSTLHTKQWGDAHYKANDGKNSVSFGDTSEAFESEADGESYQRSVRAINGTVVYDTHPGAE